MNIKSLPLLMLKFSEMSPITIEINETDTNRDECAGCSGEQLDEIIRIDGEIEYSDFFCNFLLPNRPCLFSSEFTRDWASRTDWVTGGEPELSFIESLLEGDVSVPVSDCNSRVFNSHSSCEMKFSEYREYWHTERGEEVKYLKDWHFYQETGHHYTAYTTPPYFCSDWLNEWWQSRDDTDTPNDYRFVYIGPRFSWTPFHSDVFGSFSWSANIVGRKKWIMLAPGEENKVRDTFGNVVFDLESEESKLLQVKNGPVRKMEFIQETGEIVFVPSGWHHQVYNLEDTISINHNWFNGCNLMTVYEALKAELRKVEVELDDCRDDRDEWNAMCQGLLRATHGMNYIDFLDLVTNILHTRRDLMEGRLEAVSFDGRHLGPTHCLYDIGRIREVLLELNCDFTKLDMKNKVRECELLLQCCGSLLPG